MENLGLVLCWPAIQVQSVRRTNRNMFYEYVISNGYAILNTTIGNKPTLAYEKDNDKKMGTGTGGIFGSGIGSSK